MRPFRSDEKDYERSVTVDASTVDGVTVTVAVESARSDELDILDSIYAAADGYQFFPFRDKSHDLDHEESTEVFERVINANSSRLTATTHLGNDGSDQERIEAVQSAVLVDRLDIEDTLILLDGNKDKAQRFGRAISGLSNRSVPIATCIQSELYYPTSLVADLCASYLAHRIDRPRHCSEVTPQAPITKEKLNDCWGPAYSAMVNSSEEISIQPIQQYRAETVRARVNCWFNGHMGGGDPPPFESSLQPIVNYAREHGYEELASRLSEI